MSKVYKFIHLPDHELISEKVYKFVIDHTNVMETKAPWTTVNLKHLLNDVPELDDTCVMLDLTPIEIAFVYCDAKTNLPVHVDGDHTFARLLWPIKNCQGSHTKFFELNSPDDVKECIAPSGYVYLELQNVDKATQIADVELLAPAIIKPWIPHGVWSNPECNEPRITMTIKFNKSLDFMIK